MCRAYINPFITFTDHKHWRCNFCYRNNIGKREREGETERERERGEGREGARLHVLVYYLILFIQFLIIMIIILKLVSPVTTPSIKSFVTRQSNTLRLQNTW